MSDDAPRALTRTRCCGEDVDLNTGKRTSCTEDAISPTLPYCHKHAAGIVPQSERFKRYEHAMPESLRDEYSHHMADNKPLDLQPEIAHVRALITDQLNQIRSTITEDGIIQVTPKSLILLDQLLGRIGKLAETDAKINPRDFIPIEDVKIMVKGIIDIVSKAIPSGDVEGRKRLVNSLKKFCSDRMSTSSVKLNAGRR